MAPKFKPVGIENIEGGKCAALINEYLSMTAKDLFKMADVHGVEPKKLKGKISISLVIQPLNDLEDHYSVSSQVSRSLPKIINSSIALKDEDGLFVQESGSSKESPLQTTIENFIDEEEDDEGLEKVEVIELKKKS